MNRGYLRTEVLGVLTKAELGVTVGADPLRVASARAISREDAAVVADVAAHLQKSLFHIVAFHDCCCCVWLLHIDNDCCTVIMQKSLLPHLTHEDRPQHDPKSMIIAQLSE